MRLLFLATALLGCMLTSVTAAGNVTLTQAVALMPQCALNCLVTAVIQAECQPTDETCVCRTKNEEIEKVAAPCILQACVFTDALQAKNLTTLACNAPIRDRSRTYNIMAISLGVATNTIVTARLVFKRFYSHRRSLGWDDLTILGAAVLGVPATVINVVGLTASGMGRDVWTLPPSQVARFGAFFYAMELLYLAEVAFVKLSLSVFYLYIFPGERTRRLLWATVIFHIASGVAFVVTAAAQCMPVSYFWGRYTDPNARGRCIDMSTFSWVHAGLSIAVDIFMLAIPLSQLQKLQLHWKKKIGVILMFLTGTFVTVVSVLRLKSLIYLASSSNPTWDQWIVAWWSTIEVHVGIICTCMPTMRLLLVRACPRVFGTDTSRSRCSKNFTERSTRPSNSQYIMQSKEVTLSSMDMEVDESGRPSIGNVALVETNFSRPQRPGMARSKDW